MGAYYVGLDVHSKLTTFVIQDDAATIVARRAVDGWRRCRATARRSPRPDPPTSPPTTRSRLDISSSWAGQLQGRDGTEPPTAPGAA